jgi:hypothetical protein
MLRSQDCSPLRIILILTGLLVLPACGPLKTSCTDFDPPKKGWLQDYDRSGEVSLRGEPAPPPGIEVRAVVSFASLPRGDSMPAIVIRQCRKPDGILYYFVLLEDTSSGWVDEHYFYFDKPPPRQ